MTRVCIGDMRRGHPSRIHGRRWGLGNYALGMIHEWVLAGGVKRCGEWRGHDEFGGVG